MSRKITPNDIIKQLRTIKLPNSNQDIVTIGMVSEVFINDDFISFAIFGNHEYENIRLEAERLIKGFTDSHKVMVALTTPNNKQYKSGLGQVKNIIAIASGKGGVGKSTVSANLAVFLAQSGYAVGILDADIYGPSIPTLFGLKEHDLNLDHNDKIIPLEAYDVKVMSIGFMVAEDQPLIWRGPMLIKALAQLTGDVVWGELDFLIIDMPPGTGDVQLTMAKQANITGAIIVSTPQDLAILDAKKAINMFKRIEIPILGIIENMSYFICPKCGNKSEIFSSDTVAAQAKEISIPFLGEISLNSDIRLNSDLGKPAIKLGNEDINYPFKKITSKLINVLKV